MKQNKKMIIYIVLAFLIFILSSILIYKCLNKEEINKNEEIYKYLDGYSMYNYLYKVEDRKITIAPENFDRDTFELLKDKLNTYKLSDDLVIFDYSETIKYKDNKLIDKEIKYDQIDYETFESIVNDNGSIGYIWLNDNNDVNKILLYGTLTIYE